MYIYEILVEPPSSLGDKVSLIPINWTARSVFDGHKRRTYGGGLTDDFWRIRMHDDAHVRRSAPASVIKVKMNANKMESCVAIIKSMIDHYDVDRPNHYSGGLEVVAGFARDAQAFMRGLLPSQDPDNVSRIPNPPDSYIRRKRVGVEILRS